MKYTKDPKIALTRIAPLLGMVLEQAGKQYALRRTDGQVIPGRTALRALAFLADQAQHASRLEIRDGVRWLGPVPTRGVHGWEVGALQWLRTDREG